ncbi:MAG TPA: hypothetical protein VEL73_04215 [Mycobacteriales bacterium]|nr:hypothetical protein [Mycobacteriales bacterium]
MSREASGKPKRKRWGLRTLAFLTLALASVLTSSGLSASGSGVPPITLVGVLVGFAGAAYCSVRGLKDFNWLQRR